MAPAGVRVRMRPAIGRARDAGAHRLPDYSHLRGDRLQASPAGEAMTDRGKSRHWLTAMRQLDPQKRDIETRNLPAATVRGLVVAVQILSGPRR